MGSNANKRPLSSESVHAMEARTKASLDERDEKSIVKLLKDAGVASYEPRVVSQLVDRMRRYTLEIVNDARDYADHAGRVDIEMEDVRLAVRKKQDTLTAGPPSREDIIRQADEVNGVPLPPIPDEFGVRLPPLEYQTTLPNLQWDAEAEELPDEGTGVKAMSVDEEKVSSPHGNRNKKAKATPKFEVTKPLNMKEKKEQEEISRAKAEAKAARRRHGHHTKRG